jgi:hypothetical protein
MNRIRRIAWVAGSGLAALLLAATAPLRPGAPPAHAQQPGLQAQPAAVGPAAGAAAQGPAPGAGARGTAAGTAAQGTAAGAAAQGPTAGAAGSEAPADEEGTEAVPELVGAYDIEELRRLIELARESGFSEEQVRQITVEDVNGNVINAWAFLKAHERRQKRRTERLAAEDSKVYLSPKDVIQELDEKQAQDLDRLRDKLLFVE